MFSGLSNSYKGIIFALIGFSAYSFADVSAKILGEHYSAYQITAGVACFVLPFVTLLSPWLGGFKATFATQKRKLHFVRAVTNTIISILIVTAFARIDLATIYTILFIAPFIATLMSIVFFKEKVCKHGWIAIAGGFAGVLVVFRPGLIEFNMDLIYPLVASFFIAVMFMVSRALKSDETLLSLCLFPALSNFLLIAPIAYFHYGPVAPEHLVYLAFSGAMVIVGLLGVSRAFQIAKTSIVSPFHYSQILWAVILGYLFFGDVPDLWTIAGATLIILSGIYLVFQADHD